MAASPLASTASCGMPPSERSSTMRRSDPKVPLVLPNATASRVGAVSAGARAVRATARVCAKAWMSWMPAGPARSGPKAPPDGRDDTLAVGAALEPLPSCHLHQASAVPSPEAVTSTGSTNRCGVDTFCVGDHGGSATAAAGSARAAN